MRFGRLVIKREVGLDKWRHRQFLCLCDCGTQKTILLGSLRSGYTRSCGCLHSELSSLRANRINSGKGRKHPLYLVWKGMVSRCYNPNRRAYKTYGARGIGVCPEWRIDSLAFINWCLANGWMDNLTIERIDNDGDYEPSNCEFITKSENTIRRLQRERFIKEASFAVSALALPV